MLIAYARAFVFLISWGQHISAITRSTFFVVVLHEAFSFISYLVGLILHLRLPL